jgi:hypothetical protein
VSAQKERVLLSELTGLPIRKILERVYNGQIRVPAFQRGFVWNTERIAHFMDSIYKGYPFGSLLFWSTGAKLSSERKLGPYDLPPLEKKLPLTYVLDGQQRITSLFATFQTELPIPEDSGWVDVYFDLQAEASVQQSQFVALEPENVESGRHFPLHCLFDSVKYRTETDKIKDAVDLAQIDGLHSIFKEVQIPIQIIETDDKATVAIVFERINRMGVDLSTLELLTAWTWSDSFDLQNKFTQLSDDLEEFGFGDVGEDADLILRCCAAILISDPTAEALIGLDGQEVREKWDRVENGIKGAVEFLRKQLRVASLRTLPYPALLAPLSVYFAVPGNRQLVMPQEEVDCLKKWFWRACFSERYSGQTIRASRADTLEMAKVRLGQPHSLGDFAVSVKPDFFLDTIFRMNSARTATFVTMLAQKQPRSFISGNRIDLEPVLQAYNKTEFHHMFPKAHLEDLGIKAERINCLANYCFLSRADNNKIRKDPPSVYRSLMPGDKNVLQDVLASTLATDVLFTGTFEEFLNDRVLLLLEFARELIGEPA